MRPLARPVLPEGLRRGGDAGGGAGAACEGGVAVAGGTCRTDFGGGAGAPDRHESESGRYPGSMARDSAGTTCFRRRRCARGRSGCWMRRRSTCAAAFHEANGDAPVVGKVLRGRNARRLLYYLYGPGTANEHTDPHLVAGFSDPAQLEPERRPDG